MTNLEALREGRRRITDRENWWAGPGTDPGEGAFKMCAITAIPPHASGTALLDLEEAVAELFGPVGVDSINDNFGHPYVLAAYDRAIEIEEAKEGEWNATPLTAENRQEVVA